MNAAMLIQNLAHKHFSYMYLVVCIFIDENFRSIVNVAIKVNIAMKFLNSLNDLGLYVHYHQLL